MPALFTSQAEVFVADAYGNRRAIVFDVGRGAYKRLLGAYSNKTGWIELKLLYERSLVMAGRMCGLSRGGVRV